MTKVGRFYALDSFRGLCALCVVVYHMHVTGTITELKFFQNANLFVEFFFVLSGFVLAHAYGNKEGIDLKTFFISRTFRLLPLHWFMLAVFVLLESGKLLAHKKGMSFNNEPFTGYFSPSELIPNFLLIQSWTDSTEHLSFNFPSWSISIEYYMYLVFAVILLMRTKVRYSLWGGLALVAFADIYSGSDLLTNYAAKGLLCFFSGALSYILFAKIKERLTLSNFGFTALEVASLIAVAATITSDASNKSMFTSIIFCAVVILFAFDAGAISKLLKREPLSIIGKLSYSIYLTHAAILFCITSVFMVAEKIFKLNLTPIIAGKNYLDTGSIIANNLTVFLVLFIVILLSSLTYKYIEMQGQKIGKKIITNRTIQNDASLAKP